MEIGELFRQHMGLRRLMEFLSRYQLPPVLAIRLRQQYGDGAIRVVEKIPICCRTMCAAWIFRDGHHGAVHGICRGLHGAP